MREMVDSFEVAMLLRAYFKGIKTWNFTTIEFKGKIDIEKFLRLYANNYNMCTLNWLLKESEITK